MSLFKMFLHTQDEKIAILTLTPEQMADLKANAEFMGIPERSSGFSELALEMAKKGQVKAVGISNKTREQLLEELRRNYGAGVHDLGGYDGGETDGH